MSRILRRESPARARSLLVRTVRDALTGLDPADGAGEVRDRLAFACLAMREIERSTEQTAQAWEKRGYWLKADQLRREWEWVAQGVGSILTPLFAGHLDRACAAAHALLAKVPAPDGASHARPRRLWEGAYEQLRTQADKAR